MEIVSKRPLRYPITIEREYAKFILGLSAEVRKFLKSRAKDIVDTLEGRGDDINPSVIYVIFDRLSRQMDKIVAAKVITPRLERIYKAIGNYTENELQQQYKSVFGQQMSLKFNAENSGINLNTLKGVWIDENLDLIKSIPAKALDDLKPFLRDRVLNSVNGANLVKDLTAEIERLTEVQKNRAALIATDQVGKVHGAMMRNRQTTAGIKKFKWRSSQDQRVRPRHRELNGKVFDWDNPPSEGTPGTPIRCRCVALPVFDIREALGAAQPIPGSYEPVREEGEEPIIPITRETIDNLKKINLSEYTNSDSINNAIAETLRLSMSENNNAEVLSILAYNSLPPRLEQAKGTLNSVSASDAPGTFSLMRQARDSSLVYVHNHPRGKFFSLGDIHTFVRYSQIKTMIAATNDGRIFTITKTAKYDYGETIKIAQKLFTATGENVKMTDEELVIKFLKEMGNNGIEYEAG